jgi:hypothetical protein
VTRRAHSLRLRAPSEALVRRGALLVEDALRTASLPEGRRLALIRRLDLGTIRPARSPATLALEIEARVAALGSAIVYADEPGAAAAPGVFFADEAEPYALLAARLLAGRAAPEWFWPRAVPGWRPGDAPQPGRAPELVALAAARHGVAAGVATVAALAARGALAGLLTALGPEHGALLLRSFGWAPGAQPLSAAVPPPAIARSWGLPLWAARWGGGQARSLWLAAAALAGERPARLAQPALLLAQAATLARRAAEEGEPAAPQARVRLRAGGAARPQPPAATGGSAPPAERAAESAAESAAGPQAEERAWSAGAGLLFALAALERLGIAALLRRDPALAEGGLPERLLHALAERAGVPQPDPLLAALPIPPLDPALLPQAFALPGWHALASPPLRVVRPAGSGWLALSDAGGELLMATWRERPALRARPAAVRRRPPARGGHGLPGRAATRWALLSRAWAAAAERWLERYAGLGLGELIARPGYLRASDSHIDLFFALGQADIRIRRAGLDINPGWVPWLGKVVMFFYVDDPAAR